MKGASKSRCSKSRIGRKERIKKKSVLVFGEGKTERSFLQYISSLYYNSGCTKSVKISGGEGGGHTAIIKAALTYKAQTLDFDEIYVLLDEDDKNQECDYIVHAVKRKLGEYPSRKKAHVRCIYSSPFCIEGFFLLLLDQQPGSCTQECKRLFHKQYLSPPEKYFKERYGNLYPKEMLDNLRLREDLLNDVISLFE